MVNPNREETRPTHIKREGEWYIVYYTDTGEEAGRFKTIAEARVAFPEAGAGEPTEGDGQVPIAGVEPKLSPAERDTLDIWNERAKAQGVDTIGESEADRARAYMGVFDLTFPEALTLFARWQQEAALGATIIPAPAQARRLAAGTNLLPPPVRQVIQDWAREAPRRAAGGVVPPPGLSAGALATPVGQAIAAVTDDPTVQAAMWAGAGLEGSQEGPWGTEPGGAHVGGDGEVGPWQIHPIHFGAIAVEAAADPNSAALYMLPRYEDAVKSVPAELWETDPNAALALAIANAERPAGWHEGLTAEEASAIYGGTGRVRGAATGAAAGEPTTIQGVLARGLPGADIAVTDADRIAVFNAGLDLSDADIKMAKRLGVPFEYYAFLEEAADALDTEPGLVHGRIQGGESIETIRMEAEQALTGKLVEKAALGATQAERLANYARATEAGLTLEEAVLAYSQNVPFEEAAAVKAQIATVAAGENVAPEDVPSLDEALAGRALGLTPFDVMQAGATERRRLQMTQGRMTPEEFATAEHLGRVAVARGEMTEAERAAGGGRGGLFVGGQEQARIQQRLGAGSAEEYANILMDQGLTASEVQRRVEARFSREEAAAIFGRERGRYLGYGMRAPAFATEAGERLAGQRFVEAYLEPGRVLPGRTPGGTERIEEIQAGLREARPGLAERLEERRRAREAGQEEQAVLAFMNPRRRRSQPPAGFR